MTAANSPIPSTVESERRAHEPSMEEILASIRKIIADDDALPLTRPSAPPRLFETNVTPFAPAPLREAAPQAAPVPAPAAPEPAAVASPAPQPVAVLRDEPPAAHRGDARLDAAELESFAEVGRELARLDLPSDAQPSAAVETLVETPAPVMFDAEGQGAPLRPALDGAEDVSAHLADAAEDADVNPVPHEDYAEPDDVPLIAPEPPRFSEARDERAFAFGAQRKAASPEKADPATMLSAEANATVASAFQALSASVQMASAESIDRHVREMLRPMLKQWLDDNLPVMVERMVRAEIERVARGGR